MKRNHTFIYFLIQFFVIELSLAVSRAAGHNHWKFPGGRSDPGEDIGATAVREVWEETGVRTKFESLVAFRHSHHAPFGISDL